MNKFVIMLLIIFSGFLASVSQILLKKSADIPHTSRIREYLNPYVILGYGGYACVLALRFVLQEEVTRKKILGAALIIAGVVCFAFF